jgi:hypothetical protein
VCPPRTERLGRNSERMTAGPAGIRDTNEIDSGLKSCQPTAPELPIEKRGLRYVAVFWAAVSQVLRLTVEERYSVTVAMSNVPFGR